MKPQVFSPAHTSPMLAELVCSNSLRSESPASAVGLLKEEMRRAGSLIMAVADRTRVPAGRALAVDREEFASQVTSSLEGAAGVDIVRREVQGLSDPALTGYERVLVAAGPLASHSLTSSLVERIGSRELSFYDAIAPIVSADSLNWERVFLGARYEPESTDYVNCPMDEEEYQRFVQALLGGEKVTTREFESQVHFEGCLPVEILAERGEMTLAYGPLKPVGLKDPRTGQRPFAVVQLRAENRARTMFNLVGFQTKLTYPEQKRIFRMIPGLEQARFERLGSIHRNTFVNAPQVLTPELELRSCGGVFLAGQITGVEGYVESAACGLWAGLHLGAELSGGRVGLPPAETALGGLMGHVRTPARVFQPMNVTFGLLSPLERKVKKQQRKELMVQRAREAWSEWSRSSGLGLE
jgi:methylenetetrahydrofolate--tRNA-(uracil-5-)-methyltransferase